MDTRDDGYFVYDDNFPPMCVKPPSDQVDDFKESMDGAVTAYLQESYKDGPKHEDTVLPNGLSAGEAGVLYFRELNQKRRKSEKMSIDVMKIIQRIASSLHRHMGIDVSQPRCDVIFTKYINPDLFQTKQYKRTLMPAIKSFLSEVNMKTKGYTSKLRNVMSDINALVDSENQTTDFKNP